MSSFSVADAKDNLSRLIREAESGQEIRLTRHGRPVAVLMSQMRYDELLGDGKTFRERYLDFRERHPLEEPDVDPAEVFADVRSKSTGRKFRW